MISTRVTKSYMSLFLKSKHGDGSRAAAIARIGAFEVRLIEMQTVNVSETSGLNSMIEIFRSVLIAASALTWMRRSMRLQFLIAQARQLNSEVEGPVCAVEI